MNASVLVEQSSCKQGLLDKYPTQPSEGLSTIGPQDVTLQDTAYTLGTASSLERQVQALQVDGLGLLKPSDLQRIASLGE